MTVATRPYAVHANGPRTSVRYTPGSAYRAGDVVVVGNLTLVADMDNPPNAQDGVVPSAALYIGGLYKMKADGAISPGNDVWWDDTNKKVTLTASGNTHFGKCMAGPDELSSGVGPAADQDAAWVLHDPQIAVGGALSTPITSTSANAFAVGRNGATNPAFNVDASTSSSATGLQVKSAAAAAGVALVVISSGTNEAATIDSKGSGTLTLNGTATGAIVMGAGVTMTDAKNIALATTTGTKIGTATTQKMGFFNATPVVQPAANTDATTGAAGSTTTVFLNTTFTGAAGTAAYTVGGAITALKALGLLAP